MRALQESLQGLTVDALIEGMADGVCVIDPDAIVVRANPAFCELLARTDGEVLGRPVTAFLTPLSVPIFEAEFAERKEGSRRSYKITWSRPDGRAIHTLLHPLPLHDPSDGHFLGSLAIMSDHSEIDRLADDLATSKRIVENSGLIVYRARLADDFPVEYISDSVRQLGYEPGDWLAKKWKFSDLCLPEDFHRVVAEVDRRIAKGRPRFVLRYRVRSRDGQIRHVEDRVTVRRAAADGTVHLEGILRDVSAQVQAERERHDALGHTVHALAAAVETRDPYTAGHQRRVASLALAIGRRLGIADHDLEGLYFGALIHDIGKLAVPIEILTWPGKISELQFAVLKQHCSAGQDILGDAKFPWPVGLMIAQHHERLDGSGYPHGLKGGQIVREARIVAVADVLEAMSSHRPYRAAYGLTAAINELVARKGTAFDAEAVEACVAVAQIHGNDPQVLWPALETAAGSNLIGADHVTSRSVTSHFDDRHD